MYIVIEERDRQTFSRFVEIRDRYEADEIDFEEFRQLIAREIFPDDADAREQLLEAADDPDSAMARQARAFRSTTDRPEFLEAIRMGVKFPGVPIPVGRCADN